MSDQNQGSFLGGLALGLFAGAAGYFLFGTKDGEQVRKKVEKEWQEAKSTLADEGIIKDKNASLKELISEWLGMAETKTQPKKKTGKNAQSTKNPKFKGV